MLAKKNMKCSNALRSKSHISPEVVAKPISLSADAGGTIARSEHDYIDILKANKTSNLTATAFQMIVTDTPEAAVDIGCLLIDQVATIVPIPDYRYITGVQQQS